MKPLTITNSPWAKFTTSVALKIKTNPRAISAYTQPVASPLTTWLVRISAIRRDGATLSAPPALLEFHPLAHPRPLGVPHHHQPSDPAHHAAIVAAIAVFQTPARVPVLDRSDRLEESVAREGRPRALQGFHEEGGLLVT